MLSKILTPYLHSLALLCALALYGCERHDPENGAPPQRLTIYAAASLAEALQEIGAAYSKDHAASLAFNFGGSGALAQQIMAAPRADVFLSASEFWMDALADAKLLLPDTRRTLLSNHLVVVANADSDYRLASPNELPDLRFSLLAMGDPEAVPAGRYAREWLKSLATENGHSLWTQVSERISPNPDTRAALAQVAGKRDVLGIVYHSDYLARQSELRILHKVSADEGPAISFPVAVVQETDAPERALHFLDFLSASTARSIFEKHGFIVSAQSSQSFPHE